MIVLVPNVGTPWTRDRLVTSQTNSLFLVSCKLASEQKWQPPLRGGGVGAICVNEKKKILILDKLIKFYILFKYITGFLI